MKNRSVVARDKGGGMGRGWTQLEKGNVRDPCGDGTVVSLDCVSVNTLDVTLDCSVSRGHHWEKMGKGYTRSLSIIFEKGI